MTDQPTSGPTTPTADELATELAIERRAHDLTRGLLADAVQSLARASLIADGALARLEARDQ